MNNNDERDSAEEAYNRNLSRYPDTDGVPPIVITQDDIDAEPGDLPEKADLVYRILTELWGDPDVDRGGPYFTWEPYPGVTVSLDVDQDENDDSLS